MAGFGKASRQAAWEAAAGCEPAPPGNGYPICLVFLKLFDKVYTPLTAGLLHPYRNDRIMAKNRLQQLDRCCTNPSQPLWTTGGCRRPQGCRLIAPYENKILVGAPITV